MSRRFTNMVKAGKDNGHFASYTGFSGGILLPGMELVATRWIAMRGTALLAVQKREDLRTKFSVPFLTKAEALAEQIVADADLEIAKRTGANAWYEVSEGGIFNALWNFSQTGDVGLEILLRAIPIRQETVEICEFFDLNPYYLCSEGCLLLGCANGRTLEERLLQEGIPAVWIGRATDENDRVLINGEQVRYLDRPQLDELEKIGIRDQVLGIKNSEPGGSGQETEIRR